MAPHSSTLAWKIPWTEGPGGLQSVGSLGVGHDWATSLYLFTFMHWEGNGNPLQCSCLENPRDGGAWWAAISGVAQSWTWLKRLSSSSYFFRSCHLETARSSLDVSLIIIQNAQIEKCKTELQQIIWPSSTQKNTVQRRCQIVISNQEGSFYWWDFLPYWDDHVSP